MTPITDDYLLAHGWEIRERRNGYAFYICHWNPYQDLKLSLDERRNKWRLHWLYNDTDVAAVEDIDTMGALWGRVAGLKPRTTDPLNI